jgi:hypothetical protein
MNILRMGLGKTRRFKRKNGTRKRGGAGDVWEKCTSIPPLALGKVANKYITINVTSPETGEVYEDGVDYLRPEIYTIARGEIEVVALEPITIKTLRGGKRGAKNFFKEVTDAQCMLPPKKRTTRKVANK